MPITGLPRPMRTTDRQQADRCTRVIASRETITETFNADGAQIVVTGEVQSVVDNRDAHPRNWSITFINATVRT
jgi:hypothetical protein